MNDLYILNLKKSYINNIKQVIFLVLGLIAFAISILFAYKNRHNTSELIASITLGILFATFFMVLPTEWISGGKVIENPTLYSVLTSLLYSFKALGGRQDIAQIETIALSGILKTIYINSIHNFKIIEI